LLFRHRNDARTAANGFAPNSGVSKSAKVVLAATLREREQNRSACGRRRGDKYPRLIPDDC
jgi:hypothetical protein